MAIKRQRQFRVTHTRSGLVTYVLSTVYLSGSGRWRWESERAAVAAGFRYPLDCTVSVVPRGQEVPLPFDEIPLVVREH